MAINIKALLEKAIFEATVNEDDDYFITLQHNKNKKYWLQLTGEEINTFYPYKEAPEKKLADLGLPVYPRMEVSLWEEGLFLTLLHDGTDVDEIVTFVKAYLVKVMGYVNEGSEWDISYE